MNINEKMAAVSAIGKVTKQLNIMLKEKQVEAILTYISGKDVFVTLPTGYGKSIIYGILPLIFDEYKGKYSIQTDVRL